MAQSLARGEQNVNLYFQLKNARLMIAEGAFFNYVSRGAYKNT